MSNRKKAKNEKLRLRFNPLKRSRPQVSQLGQASIVRAMRAVAADEGAIIPDETFEEMGITMPENEVTVIKEVPAVVTHPETEEKVTVGTAFIHDDGSVAIKYDEDAPEWALKYIKHTADSVGYSLETGGPKNG